jgi:hypothetical protein
MPLRVFLIGCAFGFIWGLIDNTVQASFHGPIYPLLDIATWSIAGGWMAVSMGIGDWLGRKSTYQCGSKSFLRGFGTRLLAVGLLMLLWVGMVHADRRNSDPTLRDESRLVPFLLAGGALGLVGAMLWYLGDRKSAFASLTAGWRIPPTGRESEIPSSE